MSKRKVKVKRHMRDGALVEDHERIIEDSNGLSLKERIKKEKEEKEKQDKLFNS